MTRFYGVRLTHMPTGIVVEVSDYRTQAENKEIAMRVLRSKVWAAQHPEQPVIPVRTWKTEALAEIGLNIDDNTLASFTT